MDKKPTTMADLMASLEGKRVSFTKGEKVSGKVISISGNDVILELGGKAEGLLDKRDLSLERVENLKVGDTLEAYISRMENDTGQILLSPYTQSGRMGDKFLKKWQKFITAQDRKTQLLGKITEANKGGLVVEVDKIRGFLPSSQVSLGQLSKEGQGGDLGELVGKNINVYVIEISPENNRLIFSSRKQTNDALKAQLNKYQIGQKVSGKIAGLTSFGLIVDLDSLEGVVYQQEISWISDEKMLDQYKVGQDVEAKVVGIDEVLGRLNLSIRQLLPDPLQQLVEKYQDNKIVGKVLAFDSLGVTLKLPNNLEGLIPLDKIGLLDDYQIGEEVPALIDGVDKSKRKLNLVPFLTSTKALIYK